MRTMIKGNDCSWGLTFVLAVGLLAVPPFALPAQPTATIQAGTFTLTATNISSLETLSDARLKELLQELAAMPLIWPDALPDGGSGGTYWSLAHPDSPPLPATFGSPVWKLSGASGQDFYLMDDVEYPPSPGDGDTNGEGGMDFNFQALVFTTNDLYLTVNGVTNDGTGWTANLTVHRPWNDTNLFHDVYYTTSLDAPIQWNFAMRCVYTNDVVPDLCSPIGFFQLGPAANGNLTVSTNATPQQLAEMLVPPWVTVTNATYTGANVARGSFAGGNGCGLPTESGVILATGYITNALGPNTDDGNGTSEYPGGNRSSVLRQPGDADLSHLVGGGSTLDAAVLEFDILSTNSFTLQFRCVFGSEEYPEFIAYPPNGFNDPMAIFVSTNRVGTSWINSITNDFALVPGTTNVPVTVNTINGGCIYDANGDYDSPTNTQYYVDNHDPSYSAAPPYGISAPAFNLQYDGMTVLLTTQAPISANVTNHVKIAIADYVDADYDSAVFLRTWSPCQ